MRLKFISPDQYQQVVRHRQVKPLLIDRLHHPNLQIQQHHRQVQRCQQISHLSILACFKFWPVILSVQHDAHSHLVALISTPPSGGFFKAHLLQSCNLWPCTFPFNLTWLFTKLLFTVFSALYYQGELTTYHPIFLMP
jgi:hypothetical protein